MKKLRIALIAGVMGLAFVAVGTKHSAAASTIAIQPVYRLYNHNTGEHFYTTSVAEKNADVAAGWTYESIGWTAPKTSNQPIYRVYNPNAKGGDHYYTKSKGEAQVLVGLGWQWDNGGKPVFYSGGTGKVWVAYNPNAQSGAHNYTTNAFEQNTLLKGGWKFGAVAWNALTKADLTPPVGPTAPVTPPASSNELTLDVARGDSFGAMNPENSYTFTAPSAGRYYFYSTGTLDTIGQLEDSNHQQLVYNDDSINPNGHNFGFFYTMTAGQTVTLNVFELNTLNYGNYTVVVHRPVNTVQKVTINQDENGNTLPSITDFTKYTQVSSSTTNSMGSVSINEDTTTIETTTIVWRANSTTTTPSLTLDVAKSGTISTAGQTDTYSFTASSAGTYTFYSTSSLDTYGILLDSTGKELTHDDDYQSNTNLNFSLSQTLSAGQTVTLKVGTYNSNTGAYSVTVHQPKNTVTNVTVNQDQNGNALTSTTGYTQVSSSTTSTTSAPAINGDTTTTNTTTVIWKLTPPSTMTVTLTLDSAKSGTISTAGQTNTYSFTAASAGTYYFYTTGSLDTKGVLLDSSGAQLTSNDDYQSNSNTNFSLSASLKAGQTVTLQVTAYQSNTGSYSVTVHQPKNTVTNVTVNQDQNGNALTSTTGYTQVSSSTTSTTSAPAINGDTTTTNTTTVIWKLTPPSTTTVTLTLDSAKSGTISTAGQTNTYSFTASSAGTYTFYTTGSLDTKGVLLDSTGAQLASNDDYQSSSNTNFSLSASLKAGQTVTLQVTAYQSNTGSYSVTVHQPVITTVTVNQDTNGNTITGTIDSTKWTLQSTNTATSTPAINGDSTKTITNIYQAVSNSGGGSTGGNTSAGWYYQDAVDHIDQLTSAAQSVLSQLPSPNNASAYSQFTPIAVSDITNSTYQAQATAAETYWENSCLPAQTYGNQDNYLFKTSQISQWNLIMQYNQRYTARVLEDINLFRAKLGLMPMKATTDTMMQRAAATGGVRSFMNGGNHLHLNDYGETLTPKFTIQVVGTGITPEALADDTFELSISEYQNLQNGSYENYGHLLNIIGPNSEISGGLFIDSASTQSVGGIFGNTTTNNYSNQSVIEFK